MAIKPCVKIEVLVMGMIQNNVYILEGPDARVIVDPTSGSKRIMQALDGRSLDAILITHGHFDHVNGAKELRELTGAPVIASALDAPVIEGAKKLEGSHPLIPCPVDRTVEDGEILEIGSMRWEVLVTPGHTPGSMCLFLDPRYGSDPEGVPVLVSGDTLFCQAHGRTDFVGGDPKAMEESLARLLKLPEETLVLPGHNDFTTIARERQTFSYLLHE